MKPIILSNDNLEVLNLTGIIEVQEEAYKEKSRHVEYRQAYVKCDEEAGDIITQSAEGFIVLQTLYVNHPEAIEVAVEE